MVYIIQLFCFARVHFGDLVYIFWKQMCFAPHLMLYITQHFCFAGVSFGDLVYKFMRIIEMLTHLEGNYMYIT